MRLIYCITALLILPSIQEDPCGGKNRWDVKTLTDISARSMSYKKIGSSIRKLRTIKAPSNITNSLVRQPEEKNLYSITCYITEYKIEEDGDFHLVLMDTKDSNITMVGEIPDPECGVMIDCPKLVDIQTVRNEFYNKYRMPKKRVAPGKYQVTGMFFFDKPHGQLGGAPNGAELHPILSIKKL